MPQATLPPMCAFCRLLIQPDEATQMPAVVGADGARLLFHPRCHALWLGEPQQAPAG